MSILYPQRVLIGLAHSFTDVLPGALALLIGVAGWFYLFYSRAASNLAAIEDQRLNRRRIRLRRVNAILMLVLAILIAVGYYSFDLDRMAPPDRREFAVIWLTVLVLLAVILALAIQDVRLTYRLHQTLRKRRNNR